MKTAGFSDIPVNHCQTAQCHISEGSIIRYHCRENLNCYSAKMVGSFALVFSAVYLFPFDIDAY